MDGAEDGTRCGSGVGSSVMGQGNCATAEVKRRPDLGSRVVSYFYCVLQVNIYL